MIGPAETPGSSTAEPAATPTKLYFGVLKPGSSLTLFLGTRVLPLRAPEPAMMFLGGRYVKVVRVPYNDLTDEHRRGLMEWLDMHLSAGASIAKQKIAETGFLAVAWEHFSGIVEGERKEGP